MADFSLFSRLICLLLALSGSAIQTQGLQMGINYGQMANNLPSHSSVVSLVQSVNINKVKLYNADPNVLTAFANTNVDFIVGIGNENLQKMTDPKNAEAWIQKNVQTHLPQTQIAGILVGNEVFSSNDNQLWANLLPAMQSVYTVLKNLGLHNQVVVTTAYALNILSSSFPPSSGTFREDLSEYIRPLLNFHSQIKSPFLLNAYPFFAYKGSPNQISLEYVLFQPNPGMTDPVTNLHYDNMLDAQIDAVYAAIKAMGHTDIEVRISETGWPSKGDPNETGATPENARLYNGNLLKKIEQGKGTPAKPSVPLDVYVFALFNENLKTGPASERNYGLYYPDRSQVYDIGLQLQGGTGTGPGTSTGDFPTMFSASKRNVFSVLGFLSVMITYLICG